MELILKWRYSLENWYGKPALNIRMLSWRWAIWRVFNWNWVNWKNHIKMLEGG
jgi:hypothetical protein